MRSRTSTPVSGVKNRRMCAASGSLYFFVPPEFTQRAERFGLVQIIGMQVNLPIVPSLDDARRIAVHGEIEGYCIRRGTGTTARYRACRPRDRRGTELWM